MRSFKFCEWRKISQKRSWHGEGRINGLMNVNCTVNFGRSAHFACFNRAQRAAHENRVYSAPYRWGRETVKEGHKSAWSMKMRAECLRWKTVYVRQISTGNKRLLLSGVDVTTTFLIARSSLRWGANTEVRRYSLWFIDTRKADGMINAGS